MNYLFVIGYHVSKIKLISHKLGPVHQFFWWYRVDNMEMCSLLSSVSNMCDLFGLNAGAGITRLVWLSLQEN